jgi:hypothetical protein
MDLPVAKHPWCDQCSSNNIIPNGKDYPKPPFLSILPSLISYVRNPDYVVFSFVVFFLSQPSFTFYISTFLLNNYKQKYIDLPYRYTIV